MDEPGEVDNGSPRKRQGNTDAAARKGRPGQSRRRQPSLTRQRRPRPPATELFAAVVELVASGASAFKGTARRYSICGADADDAYQRGLEILMTKAPTASRAELQPWLHTVIKHEALALRRQRERLLAGGQGLPGEAIAAESVPSPDEGAAERERVRQTAEALGELKTSELQCLLLKALGYSYEEISARTGFSWTKVNRSLTEGRKRFFARFDQIESGERCEKFAPLLSAASDGEASLHDERRLKAHLRSCHSCRAVLRGYRTVPIRLAQLLPPAVLVPTSERGWWSRLYESVVIGTGDRAAAIGYKLQHAGEVVAGQKTAAVVASTAALAGGATVHERASGPPHREKQTHAAGRAAASTPSPDAVAAPESPPPAPAPTAVGTDVGPRSGASSSAQQPASEFSPEQVGTEAGPPDSSPQPSKAPAVAESAASAPRAKESDTAAGSGEFGP